MNRVLAGVVILSVSLSVAAQSAKSAQAVTPKAAHKTAKSKTKTPATPQVTPRELEESLDQLQRVVDSTNNDISSVQVEKWGGGSWKNPLHRGGDKGHKEQAAKLAESLQRNLSTALPQLVHEAQVSHGAFAPTFKLYDNVNVVYELLDSLVDLTNKSGKKQEYQMLAYDFSSLGQVRRTLSNYIEQAAVALDKHKPLGTAASVTTSDGMASGPTKIIIDDNVPARSTRRSAPETRTAASSPAVTTRPAAVTNRPAAVSSPIENSFVSNMKTPAVPAPSAKPAVTAQPAQIAQPLPGGQTAQNVQPAKSAATTPAAAAVPAKVVVGDASTARASAEQPKIVLTEVKASSPTAAAATPATQTTSVAASQPATAAPAATTGNKSSDPFADLPRPAKAERDPFADLSRTQATEPAAQPTVSAAASVTPVAAPKAAAKVSTDDAATTQPAAAKKPKIVIEN